MKGTMFVSDLTGAYLAGPNNQSVIQIGEQSIAEQFMARLDIHNRQLRELTTYFAAWTPRNVLAWGGYDKVTMTRTDEPGTARPSKVKAGYIVGLPLDHYEDAWQGSFHWFQRITPAGLAIQMKAMLDADARNLTRAILQAIFNPTNRLVVDTLTDGGVGASYKLPVKALVNGDGLDIPPGPNGEYFDGSTHTHYAATTDFTTAGVSATVETVREHERDSRPEVWIPKGLEIGIRAMTGNFIPYVKENVRPATTSSSIVDPGLDVGNPGDRTIGEFDGCPVVIKPIMPAGYLLVIETNPEAAKVVGIRYDDVLGGGALTLANRDEEHPLRAETYYRDFGCGVWNRTGAAVLKPNNGDTTYVAPSLAA